MNIVLDSTSSTADEVFGFYGVRGKSTTATGELGGQESVCLWSRMAMSNPLLTSQGLKPSLSGAKRVRHLILGQLPLLFEPTLEFRLVLNAAQIACQAVHAVALVGLNALQ